MSITRGVFLKDKTAERLAEAFEDLLAQSQLTATEIMKALVGAPLSSKEKVVVRIGLKGGMKQTLKKYPEPSKDKLSQVFAMINALKGTPHKLRELLEETAKELPHAPGGARKKIKPEEETTVCAEIIALRAEYDTRDAIRRVASKRGVSERTVYRVWGKYHPKKRRSQGSPNP